MHSDIGAGGIGAGGIEAGDDDLMRRIADGDREAFAVVYRRHHAAVFRFARLMTGSHEAAEDVVQEVFIALMRGAARYDATRATLTTYLYGSARNHIRRRWLRDRLFVSLDGYAADVQEPVCHTADELLRQRDVQDLRRAIVRLPHKYREVIVLCDLQDLSYADAATALACAVGTVRSRLHRARQLLTSKMQRSRACTQASPRPALRYEV